MVKADNLPSFHLWWRENLVKYRKVLIYYQTDYLQNIVLLFLFLLVTNFVKNSHISDKIFYIFQRTVLNPTWNTFNTKFRRQWKGRKKSYLVTEAFALFFQHNCSNFSLKQSQKIQSYTNSKRESRWTGPRWGRIKNTFPERSSYKISETNSSFLVKEHTTGNV